MIINILGEFWILALPADSDTQLNLYQGEAEEYACVCVVFGSHTDGKFCGALANCIAKTNADG